MAGKKPEGGGMGRGFSRAIGMTRKTGQKKIVDITTKKPLTKADIKKREDAIARKKAIANTAITKGQVKYAAATKAAPKPMGITTRGKVVGTVVGGAAVVGTTKGMKKAGEANAARIRRNKAKSVPVPRNPRKQ
jgi:hypothetical protein